MQTSAKVRIAGALALSAALLTWTFVGDTDEAQHLARCLVLGEGRFVGEVPEQFEVDYFGNVYIGSGDNLIDRRVYTLGAWEGNALAVMEDLLTAVAPRGVVVDVGANVGTHAIYMANHSDAVHAIEPWPPALERLREMIDRNELKNIIVHEVGFAEAPGSLPYFVPKAENQGTGTFSPSAAEAQNVKEKIDLPLVVGDDWFSERNVTNVAMIKIDIEGYEPPALRGLHDTLWRDRPIVIMELNSWNEEGFHSEDQLRSVFPPDYEFYLLTHSWWEEWTMGDWAVACHHPERRYGIVPFDMTFGSHGRTLIIVPPEARERFSALPDRATVRL